MLNNAIAILGATMMSSSQLFHSIECLIAGRFFIGLNCGLNTALVPMYLSEIAPMTLRGALGKRAFSCIRRRRQSLFARTLSSRAS